MFIFDFDGVLIDSLEEVGVTAHNTLRGDMAVETEALDPGYLARFKNSRASARNAGELVVLADWCMRQRDVLARINRVELQAWIKNSHASLLELEKRFFERRTALAEGWPSKWLALNTPYEPLWTGLKGAQQDRLVILTFKNRRAVMEICRHYGICLEAGNVYSGDNGTGKVENFASICERFDGDPLFFVDDSVTNLLELRESFGHRSGLKLLHARWGYLGPDDERAAKAARIEGVSQEDLLGMIKQLS